MSNNINEQWLSRQDLANRYGLPVKTLARWASIGNGPPYARMGRHVRYRLSDVIAWETARIEDQREAASQIMPSVMTNTRPATQTGLGGASNDPNHL
jgi:predicted DNA-binding transcriptional regulator AlpA